MLPEYIVSKDVNINYTDKTISFSCLDIEHSKSQFESIKWLQKLSQDPSFEDELVLATYDGNGSVLYEVKFTGITIKKHTTHFNYEISDVSSQDICLSFEKYEFHIRDKKQTQNYLYLEIKHHSNTLYGVEIEQVILPQVSEEESHLSSHIIKGLWIVARHPTIDCLESRLKSIINLNLNIDIDIRFGNNEEWTVLNVMIHDVTRFSEKLFIGLEKTTIFCEDPHIILNKRFT
jgi:hypothetical protein